MKAAGCTCCAYYDIYRAAWAGDKKRRGLCIMCLVFPSLCETGHRMIAGNPTMAAIERDRIERNEDPS